MDFESLYRRILKIVNYFLKEGAHLNLQVLKDFDPSVEQIAKDLRMLSGILKELASDNYDDQNMAINAFQCVLIMEQIAKLVVLGSNDEAEYERFVKSLEALADAPLGCMAAETEEIL